MEKTVAYFNEQTKRKQKHIDGLKNSEISGLRKFLRSIEFVRVIAPEMPIQYFAGLLAIARRDLEGNPMTV